MITLRCSALPLFMRCAGSVRGEVRVSEWNEATDMGTAVHDALARYIKGLPVDQASVASLHGVDEGELSMLFHMGMKMWGALHPGGKHKSESERRLTAMVGPSLELTGTADVITQSWSGVDGWQVGGDGTMAVEVLDWKTARRDADHREQLMGYAALALLNHPEAAYAFGRIAWLRTDETEVYSLTRGDMVHWRERLLGKVEETEYRPGPHCQYCPRHHSCPAHQEMQRGALAVVGAPRVSLAEMSSPEKLSLYHKAKSVRALADTVLDEVRSHVQATGPIEDNGIKLQIIEETRRSLKPAPAWPVLQKYLNEEQFAECVTVSLSRAEDAAAKGQPRGEGAKRTRAMLADLNTAQAIGTTTIQKLTERRS